MLGLAALVLTGVWAVAWRPVVPGTISWLLFKVLFLAIVPNIVMYLWIGSGIIAYHRLFGHRSFRCKPWLEALLLIGGGMALEGPAVRWVKVHKTHHWFADRPGDRTPLCGTGVEVTQWTALPL
jgi:stearoyl-CoA desaturase (delta-9 desaturase)